MFLKRGMSLVELMVAAGILSALALGSMRMLQSQKVQTKKVAISLEVENLHSRVNQYMLDRDACTNTLAQLGNAINASADSALTVAQGIRDRNNVLVIPSNGTEIGRSKISISTAASSSIRFARSAGTWTVDRFNIVTMSLFYHRMSAVVNATEADIRKEIDLLVYYDSTLGRVTDCFSNTASAIETAKRQYCVLVGGAISATGPNGIMEECLMVATPNPTPNPTVAASTLYVQQRADAMSTALAEMADATYVHKAGDTMTGALFNTVGVSSPRFCIGGDCRTTFATTGGSNVNEFISTLMNTGQANTTTTTGRCGGVTPYMTGFNADGTIRCQASPNRNCPAGQRVIKIDPDGTITCEVDTYKNIACADSLSFMYEIIDAVPSCRRINQPSIMCGPNSYAQSYDMFNPGNNRCGNYPALTVSDDGYTSYIPFNRADLQAGGWDGWHYCPGNNGGSVVVGAFRFYTNGGDGVPFYDGMWLKCGRFQ